MQIGRQVLQVWGQLSISSISDDPAGALITWGRDGRPANTFLQAKESLIWDSKICKYFQSRVPAISGRHHS